MFTTDRVSVGTDKTDYPVTVFHVLYVETVDDCNIYYNTQTVVKGWHCMYPC